MTTATKTKEYPILFTGEMVRAILDGTKTQTRRVIKPQPEEDDVPRECHVNNFPAKTLRAGGTEHVIEPGVHTSMCSGDVTFNDFYCSQCPYGELGDRLWVRETWRPWSWHEGEPVSIEYRADGSHCETVADDGIKYDAWDERIRISITDECQALKLPMNENEEYYWDGDSPLKWRPSIYMPRWASRINLLVKKIRVERVQDITPEDVIAEGLTFPVNSDKRPLLRITGRFPPCNYYKNGDDNATFIKAHYASLWDKINHERGFGWDTNPWVWIVEFERAV